MRNPLRTEAEAFRFLVVVIAGAIVVVAAAYINTWVGVAAAVLVIGGVGSWLMRARGSGPPPALVSSTPGSARRVLVVAAPGTTDLAGRIDAGATEILVVVPALASHLQSLTGAVDDQRADAQHTADALAAELTAAGRPTRSVVGADDAVLAAEDALRTFGADEIVLAMGDDALLAHARERFAVPVSRA
jgi:hypothetical protein